MELKRKLSEVLALFIENKEKSSDLINNSIGNEGVYANMHSFMHANMHTDTRQTDRSYDSLSTVEKLFNSLTKKEFLIFLTIYQLEDDIKNVTYEDISKHLKLTQGCIRTHITNIIRKDLPLVKNKINNKLTLLSIDERFRELGIKTKLINLYSKKDPSQTTLDRL